MALSSATQHAKFSIVDSGERYFKTVIARLPFMLNTEYNEENSVIF